MDDVQSQELERKAEAREKKRGLFIQGQNARAIARNGSKITLASGAVIPAILQSLIRRDHDLLMEAGTNVSNSDLRDFLISPLAVQAWPAEGSTLLWRGESYTILLATPDAMAGVITSVHLLSYRTPLPASASTATATEQNPGKRKTYAPPDSTV